jgi:hypothetical protein
VCDVITMCVAVWCRCKCVTSLPCVLLCGAGVSIGGDRVTVFTRVGFAVEPSDVVAVLGRPALLNCSALSSPSADPPHIHWLRDSVALNFDTNDRW